jgi:hypothetical protein
LGYYIQRISLSINFDTKWNGLQFGWFFHTLFWGRCYDHKFLRFSPIFGEKMAFFLNTNVMIIFSKFRFVLSQKRQFFR